MGLANWDEAPRWAYYHAIDACGVRVWHQHKPYPLGKINEWASSGFHAIYGRIIDMTGIDWRKTLERRPRPTETPATDSAYSVPGEKHADNYELPTKPRAFTKTF